MQQSPVILELCFRKARSGKSPDYCDNIVLEKLRFQNVFRLHEYEKPVFSNSCGLKSVFVKLGFRGGSSVDGRLNRRSIGAFSNFFGVVLTEPEFSRTRLRMLLKVLSLKARELDCWLLVRNETLLIMTSHHYMYFPEALVWPLHLEMGQ